MSVYLRVLAGVRSVLKSTKGVRNYMKEKTTTNIGVKIHIFAFFHESNSSKIAPLGIHLKAQEDEDKSGLDFILQLQAR